MAANNRRMEPSDVPSLRIAITRAESRLGQRATAAFVAMLADGGMSNPASSVRLAVGTCRKAADGVASNPEYQMKTRTKVRVF
jgi:hypothetical protein